MSSSARRSADSTRFGSLAAASAPCRMAPFSVSHSMGSLQRPGPMQSGDAVRTRMSSGVSPLLHRAPAFGAEAVRTRINSGASPHHRNAPDSCAGTQDAGVD